jgi:hypothetical protein
MWNAIRTLTKKSGLKQTKFGKRIVRFRKVWNFADFYLDTIDTLKRNPPFDFAYMDVDYAAPSMSPNIWSTTMDIIEKYQNPSVLEYGLGISTYHICKTLFHSEGSYEGLEHNTSWFKIVEHWIQLLLAAENRDSKTSLSTRLSPKQHSDSPPLMNQDVIFNKGRFQIKLSLRPVEDYTGDGLLKDFYDYVTAPSSEYDVVIVDGRCRNGTLWWISEKEMVKKGGTLILHDAYQKIYNEGISLFPAGRYIDGRGGFKNPLNPEQHPDMFRSQEAYIWVRQ